LNFRGSSKKQRGIEKREIDSEEKIMDSEQAEFARLEKLMLEAKENSEKERMSAAIAEAE
jgi:hypothetical protein